MLDGDEWVINGQKIWTTQGFVADYIFILCRTDPDASKHKGISYLLVPMKQPGVEVRPIEQVDGSAEFYEVFFTDARCPKDNVVGGLNNGWKVAMTTLGFERGTSATTGYRRFEKELDIIIDAAKANGAIDDPLIRQRIALGPLAGPDHADQRPPQPDRRCSRARRTPASPPSAPPTRCSGASTTRRSWSWPWTCSAWRARSSPATPTREEAVPGYGLRAANAEYPASTLQSSFFFSRSETIWGGTAQIQRNIVGERFLGLPKEPKVETAKK